MVQCCVPYCFNRNDVNKDISFHRFPQNEKEKKKWLKLIRRDFTPNCHSRVCGWHFPSGKAAGPTRFAWNDGKAFPDPKRRKAKVSASVDDEGIAGPSQNCLNVATQTQSISCSDAVLKIEKDMLRQEWEEQKQTFSFSQISSQPNKVNYYTGLPDAATVLFLEDLLSKFELKYYYGWNVQIMPLIDQLFMTLIKLRLNCSILDLSTKFNCSRATVTNIFITITSVLYDILYVGIMENNIPSRVKNQASLPLCFQPFPDCRIVLDCIEVSMSNTERPDTQSNLYSHFKGRTTLKALIGVAPNGVITFASDLYGGSTSDKVITADCGVLQQLEPGDMVVADKGFNILDILPYGVSLNRLVAQARIHVQRSIQCLKAFHILSYIPYRYKKHANKILKVCVCLSNLQKPIL